MYKVDINVQIRGILNRIAQSNRNRKNKISRHRMQERSIKSIGGRLTMEEGNGRRSLSG
ncbi:expressed protein [Batrachochytrium dendrobatidis JAM81]|uniref:Expressed protein n=1 Tax=Batrachochytrium dendrobatidis (strain JAM81 / FGSC 10211) TaxID=684364 RepID=F4P0Y2_BATDJ|nr:uncharacterized protein BATDEDRAFT_31662 [Batrachochytrium dendrobatidis JAM81]EGF81361.1 expressed protein [Batrachochytrium dendrobatidis JAM81]|eukprot:XP_006677972.1 expressed protein [Batrachochytrium dendrobatidis JAM81]